MTPRKALLQVASADSLRTLVGALGLVGVDVSDREAMARALESEPDLLAPASLALLADDELRTLARACGLLGTGSRQVLLERLERRASFAPAPPRTRRARSRGKDGGRWTYDGFSPFVAIDFETADRHRDSACSVALVRVENGEIARVETRLIRPPRRRIEFTRIHGITWEMVEHEPTFAEVWPELAPLLKGASFLAAHNAPFDRSVLAACCEAASLPLPPVPFRCTVKLSRQRWGLRRARLPDVCGMLGIDLEHHDATSDALACARIVLASTR